MFSYGSFEQTSYGLMVGVVKKTGGYLKVKTDFGSVSSDLDPVDKASGWYTGGEQQSRFAITAGVLNGFFNVTGRRFISMRVSDMDPAIMRKR